MSSSRLTINSNLASLNAQRRLSENSSRLQQIFTRLSSGLRINRASDDAAGLAVAENLNVDSRVYGQAIRNVNDAISVSSIAQGAMTELSNVVSRISELAEQSANGVLSHVQRQALDKEAQALKKEYNRIVDATEFNGLKLLDGSLGVTDVMAGYDAVSLSLSDLETSSAGDGSFKAMSQYSAGNATATNVVDVNQDGILDITASGFSSGNISVSIGNGDGSFKAPNAYVMATGNAGQHSVSDINGDGVMDIVASNGVDGGFAVAFGNGNGTFRARVSYATGLSNTVEMELADFNGDGVKDVISGEVGQAIALSLGNSNGTFRAAVNLPGNTLAGEFSSADVNNDGRRDIVVTSSTTEVFIFLGNGDGTFQAARTNASGSNANGTDSTIFADVNGDGYVDLMTASQSDSQFNLSLGNGDGTFRARTQLATGSGARAIAANDIDGDGDLDVIVTETGAGAGVSFFSGNGDGTFKARVTYINGSSNFRTIDAVDINGDGARDLVIGSGAGGLRILLGNADKNPFLQYFSIGTQESALETLDMTRTTLANIAASIGRVGASESRLSTTLSTLQQTRENTLSAASRIQDADVAEESANLVRLRILQQASAAVLSQANQLPSLVLKLIG